MFSFTIPMLPPSVNKLYNRSRGMTFKSKEAKTFEAAAYYDLLPFRPDLAVDYPCHLTLTFTFNDKYSFARSDLDNLLKCTLDALQDGKLLKNDCYVRKITANKQFGQSPSVHGTIEPYEDLSTDQALGPRPKVRRKPRVLQPGDGPGELQERINLSHTQR